MRKCGDCQLCCVLQPINQPGFEKPRNTRCPNLSRTKGCKIYAERPRVCREFRCQWLSNADTGDMRRPDRAGYYISPFPDVIRDGNHVTNQWRDIQCVEIFCDPKRPEAWRDDALLSFLFRRGNEEIAAIFRYCGAGEDFVLMPPQMTKDGSFHARNLHIDPSRTGTDRDSIDVLNRLGAKARVCL